VKGANNSLSQARRKEEKQTGVGFVGGNKSTKGPKMVRSQILTLGEGVSGKKIIRWEKRLNGGARMRKGRWKWGGDRGTILI